MKLCTLTTGVGIVTTQDANYLPMYLYYVATTQLTGLKVTVAGDGVVLDLDAAGLNSISGIRRFGAVANSFYIPLADGFVPNKVVIYEFTNSAAQTPDIFSHSLANDGDMYIVSTRTKVLASSGHVFRDFAHLSILAAASGDMITVGFSDGLVQDFRYEELLGWYTLYSNEVDSYCIDNIAQAISYVKLIPAADRVCVVTKYIPVGEIV